MSDPRTASGKSLGDRLIELERRLAALEAAAGAGLLGTDQTIKGSHDRLDSLFGAGNDALTTGPYPTHAVAGALSCETDFTQETNALYRIVRLGVGYKAGVADNTLTDILNITGPGGTSGSTYRGVILGTLDLVYTGRNTSGYTMACFYRSYLYAVQPSNTAISIALTQLTNNSYSTGAYTVTLTVQAKAGASATLGVIEAKATHTNYDAASNRWYWRFEGLAAAYSASNMLVPANAT